MVLRMLSHASIAAAISAANCALRVLRFWHPTARQLWQLHSEETVLKSMDRNLVCLYTSTILFYSLFYRLRRMGYLCARRQRLTNVELGSRAFQGLPNHPYAGVRAPEYAPHGPFNLL